MEIGVAVRLNIRQTDAGVTHDGGAAAGFHCCGGIAVAGVVLGMVGAELVPYFMGHIVNVKSVTYRRIATGDTSRLAATASAVYVG